MKMILHGQEIEMEDRRCKCGAKFRVNKGNPQKTCSRYCRFNGEGVPQTISNWGWDGAHTVRMSKYRGTFHEEE